MASKNIFFRPVAPGPKAVLDERSNFNDGNAGTTLYDDNNNKLTGISAHPGDVSIFGNDPDHVASRMRDPGTGEWFFPGPGRIELVSTFQQAETYVSDNAGREDIGGNIHEILSTDTIIGQTGNLVPGTTALFGRTQANMLGPALQNLLDADGNSMMSHQMWTIPSITKASFQVNGDFGSLRKAEIEMVCAGLNQLNVLDKAFVIGQTYDFYWGSKFEYPENYCGSESGTIPSEKYVLYDASWKYIHSRLIELTYKFVGAGALGGSVDANNTLALEEGPEFIYDWKHTDETRKVQSLIDAIDYDYQNKVETSNSILPTSAYNIVKHRKAVLFSNESPSYDKDLLTVDESKMSMTLCKNLARDKDMFGFAIGYKMDNIVDFNESNALAGSDMGNDALEIYYSLGYVVHRLINGWLLEWGQNKKIAESIKNQKYIMAAWAKQRPHLISCDPLNILFTSSEEFNNQCTFGKYYTTDGREGRSEDDTGGHVLLSPDGKDFRILDIENNSGLNDITTDDLCTYTKDLDDEFIILCENILISRNFLRRIDPNKKVLDTLLDVDTKADSDKTTSDDQVSVTDFMRAIFKKIRQVTDGYIDLIFQIVPSHEAYASIPPGISEKDRLEKYPDKILIINQNAPISAADVADITKEPVSYIWKLLDTDYNLMKADLSSKVPKDMAAEAFGRNTPGKTGGTNAKRSLITKEEKEGETGTPASITTEIIKNYLDVRNKLYESGFDSNSSSAALGIMKDLYNRFTKTETLVTEQSLPYPLQLTLVIHGVYGLRFGDVIVNDFVPQRYRDLNMDIVHTIIELTHEIEGRSSEWVTQIKTIARLVGTSTSVEGADTAITKAAEEYKEAVKKAADAEKKKRQQARSARAAGFRAGPSDIRLKENISQIKYSASGIPIYEFNYINSTNRFQGAMAQDLISLGRHDAVFTYPDGYYGVNYDLIDVNFKQVSINGNTIL